MTLKSEKDKAFSTQRYLQFAGARDSILILKDGGVRAILEVSSVNFNLKSEAEQNSIILAYQRFLNSLSFPVEILMRSYKLDIEHYLDMLGQRKKKLTNQLLRDQMEEYIEYIQKLVEYSDIMEKKFFVIVPVDPPRAEKKSMIAKFWSYIHPDDTVMDIITRRKEFQDLKRLLETRVNVVQTSLENCGLKVNQLDTEAIISLFYQVYNPLLSRTQKIKNIGNLSVSDGPEETIAGEVKS